MMPDYLALKTTLAASAYAEMTDAQAAVALNAATVTRARTIPAAEIKRLWGRWGVLGLAWVKAQDANLPDQVRAICRATYDNLMHDLFTDLDPSEAEALKDITMYLGALVGAGVLTEDQRDATLALAQETVPLLAALNWGGAALWPADVTSARAMKD